jgi:hypothetical protein
MNAVSFTSEQSGCVIKFDNGSANQPNLNFVQKIYPRFNPYGRLQELMSSNYITENNTSFGFGVNGQAQHVFQ